jgi:hypothetical protein
MLKRVSVLVVLLLVGAGALAPAMASATEAAGVVTGSATMAPGLSDAPASQAVTVEASMAVAYESHGVAAPVVVACSFSGGSTSPETSVMGAGTLSGSCNPTFGPPITVSCSLAYQRIATVLTTSGSCNVSTPSWSEVFQQQGAFALTPTSGTPATSFVVAGGQSLRIGSDPNTWPVPGAGAGAFTGSGTIYSGSPTFSLTYYGALVPGLDAAWLCNFSGWEGSGSLYCSSNGGFDFSTVSCPTGTYSGPGSASATSLGFSVFNCDMTTYGPTSYRTAQIQHISGEAAVVWASPGTAYILQGVMWATPV